MPPSRTSTAAAKKNRNTWHCVRFLLTNLLMLQKVSNANWSVVFYSLQKPVERKTSRVSNSTHSIGKPGLSCWHVNISAAQESDDHLAQDTFQKRVQDFLKKNTITESIHFCNFFVCLFIHKPFTWWKFPQPVFNRMLKMPNILQKLQVNKSQKYKLHQQVPQVCLILLMWYKMANCFQFLVFVFDPLMFTQHTGLDPKRKGRGQYCAAPGMLLSHQNQCHPQKNLFSGALKSKFSFHGLVIQEFVWLGTHWFIVIPDHKVAMKPIQSDWNWSAPPAWRLQTTKWPRALGTFPN